MEIVVSSLIILVCVLLAIVVLVQNSKGGGLSNQFSASNQIMGVRKTADFLEKATWTLAIALVVLSLASPMVFTGSSSTSTGVESEAKKAAQEKMNNIAPVLPNTPPAGAPQAPANPPANNGGGAGTTQTPGN